MGAFERLPPAGRQACSALSRSTPWSAEEWARSVRTLDRAGLFPAIGLTDVFGIVQRTGVPPDDVAAMLVGQAAAVASSIRGHCTGEGKAGT